MSDVDPVVALFATRLRREREQRGWGLRELAGRAGTDFGRLSRVENQQGCPSLITAVRLARALGIPLGEMVATPLCENCDGKPPAGFICEDCGRKGER